MTENDDFTKPLLWMVDSERNILTACRHVFEAWADCLYVPWGHALPDWEQSPDAIFFSAEIPGGAEGPFFSALVRDAGGIPLLTVSPLRSLAQAVAYFRAGAADYLTLPLEEEEARERFSDALERMAQRALHSMVMELERVDQDAADVHLSLRPDSVRHETAPPQPDRHDEDILAQLPLDEGIIKNSPAFEPTPGTVSESLSHDDTPALPVEQEDEPIAVDGLPIPSLWEELPCGLLVFDSLANLVFANRLGLELFGHDSLAALQDVLENHRDSFAPHALNHKPLPGNQWPHILAVKARAARSAVLSLEKPDRRRIWLRIDCMPHLTDGAVSRLSMTLVNLTGELPPFVPAKPTHPEPSSPVSRPTKKERGKARGKKRR